MDLETVRLVSLARHLYDLGISNLRSANDLHLFAAVNLIQDAVEIFLIAVAGHVEARIEEKTPFDKYLVAVNDRIRPRELPFKTALLRLNKIRVGSKHYGIQPARDECERLAASVRAFFDEVTSSELGASFSTLSAIDLLAEGEIKEVLLEAKTALEAGKHEECVTSCRKAVYLLFERYYDISQFKDSGPLKNILSGAMVRAPEFTKNSAYIAKHVKDPTDFIVLDHHQLEGELLKMGVHLPDFWNIWRLTPEVFRSREGRWFVKRTFQKLDEELLVHKAEYVFSKTVDLCLAIDSHRTMHQYPPEDKRYVIRVRGEGVRIFEKADRASKVVARTPPEMVELTVDFNVPGFEEDGPFWHVLHYEREKGLFLSGYIHDEDVEA